jgi:hypothetical protein
MPSFSLTDDLGKPFGAPKVDFTSASSLFQYLKSEALHLVVAGDFLALKDQPLTQAAPNPIQFQLKAANLFQLGNATPEIDVTPGLQVRVRANTTKGSNLFQDDPFQLTAAIPEHTGYVGLQLAGSLDLGVSGSVGDLTFGFDARGSIAIESLKAFATDAGGPTLGDATSKMLSSFVIPAGIADLARLQANDVSTVSGQGSLTLSAGFDIATPVNPLASVNLPLGVGILQVKDGVMAGVSASFRVTGSYQIRARGLATGAVELSFLKERGTTLKTDLTASAGVSVTLGRAELLATLLGAIGTGTVDRSLLDGLTPAEIETFTGAVQEGVDHSVQASVDLALSTSTDDQAVFQYEIRPELLDDTGKAAVQQALRGDLSQLTRLEQRMQVDGTLVPGVRLLNSVLSQARTRGVSLKVNLLGIVNLISLSRLITGCEFLMEPASGELTIKETARSERISAITSPFDRQEALRKALFNSVMVTTTYRVSKAIAMPELKCRNLHFAVNQNTNVQTLSGYLNWFVALALMGPAEKPGIVSRFSGGGPSTCLMRTEMDDPACESLFFDAGGNLRPESDYREIGRQALRALLDPASSEIDAFRAHFLEDPTWAQALEIGPSPQLRTLIPLSSTDARRDVVLADVTGDLYDIAWWAAGMGKAGKGLQEMRTFLAGRDPLSLAGDADFAQRRDKLQKLMAGVVSDSKLRFHEPWGMVCLFRASGSAESSGRLVAGKLVVERRRP